MDANRQAAGVREVPDDRDPPVRSDVGDELGEVVDRDGPVPEQGSAIGFDGRREPGARRLRG
jgi:hypothetical protein